MDRRGRRSNNASRDFSRSVDENGESEKKLEENNKKKVK